MKKVMLLFMVGCILLSGYAYAQTPSPDDVYTNDGRAKKVYATPNTGSKVVYTLSANEFFHIEEVNGSWYGITVYSSPYHIKIFGWIHAENVVPKEAGLTSRAPADSRQTGLARIHGDGVNFREAPVDGKIITRLPDGVAVYVFDQMEGEDGNTWYHVNAMHRSLTRKGWVRGDLLVLPDALFCDIVDIAADESHVIALKADGTLIAGGTGHCDCTNVEGLYDAVDVSSGFYTSFVFFKDGSYWGRGLAFPPYLDIGFDGLAKATSIGNQFVGVDRNGSFMVHPGFFSAYDDDENLVRDSTYDATALQDIIQIAPGVNLMVCLTADGRPHMYGFMYGSRPDLHRAVEGWENIVKVSAFNHVVGLRADGTVEAAGENMYGECDVKDWTDIVDIAASEDYTLGLRADGTVIATGNNPFGACEVDGFTDIVQIEASRFFSVGLTRQGTLRYAGDFRFLDKTDAQGYIYMSSGE